MGFNSTFKGLTRAAKESDTNVNTCFHNRQNTKQMLQSSNKSTIFRKFQTTFMCHKILQFTGFYTTKAQY